MVTPFYHYNDVTDRRTAVRFFIFPTGWYGYHSGKSVTIRESNHGSGVCKEHNA